MKRSGFVKRSPPQRWQTTLHTMKCWLPESAISIMISCNVANVIDDLAQPHVSISQVGHRGTQGQNKLS